MSFRRLEPAGERFAERPAKRAGQLSTPQLLTGIAPEVQRREQCLAPLAHFLWWDGKGDAAVERRLLYLQEVQAHRLRVIGWRRRFVSVSLAMAELATRLSGYLAGFDTAVYVYRGFWRAPPGLRVQPGKRSRRKRRRAFSAWPRLWRRRSTWTDRRRTRDG